VCPQPFNHFAESRDVPGFCFYVNCVMMFCLMAALPVFAGRVFWGVSMYTSGMTEIMGILNMSLDSFNGDGVAGQVAARQRLTLLSRKVRISSTLAAKHASGGELSARLMS